MPDVQMTAQERYEHLKIDREPYLRRARECAEVTLPYLFPPDGSTGDTDLPTPFQSVGSRGVNNLGSKLLLALFPPNTSFFEITLNDFVIDELAQANLGDDPQQDPRAEFESALSKIVRAVEQETEQLGVRRKVFQALKNLIVGGNVLARINPDNSVHLTPLERFVVHRDGEGDVTEIIRKETIARATAPEEVLQIVGEDATAESEEESATKAIDIFTWIRRKDGKWKIHQEVSGEEIPGTASTDPLDNPSYIALRMIEVDGEHYGRSYVEEYLGDLISLEKNTQSVTEFSSAAARILFMVEDAGVTDPDDIANAPSGSVVTGNEDDVSVLALEKFADFRITDTASQRMEKRLERAFLLFEGVQRDAERVTAEEIRRLANELEESLGGVYSLLAEEFQAPFIKTIMKNLRRRGELPKLPEKLVNFQVVTGIAALGRNSDLAKLDTFVAGIQQTAGPEAVADYLKLGAYFKRRAAALNIDIDGMIRTEGEVSQIRQQRQQAEMAKAAAPAGVNFLNERASEAAEQPGE